jgi:hypothetical protein
MEDQRIPMRTTYKVTAATGFGGHKEGEEFEAELTEEQERRAIERGSIEPVKSKGKEKKGDA